MRRFASLAAMLLVGVLAFGASTAPAAQPASTTISWFSGAPSGCRDGTATVPAGNVQVRFGWGTYSNNYTNEFLRVQQVVYSVDGNSVTQPIGSTSNWKLTTGKDPNGTKLYVAQYTSPTLATLASGQSITVTFSLKTVGADAYDDAQTVYPEGTELLGSYTTCTITAA